MKLVYFLLSALLFLAACESTTSNGEQEEADTTQNSRGLMNQVDESEALTTEEPAGLVEQLYGTWKLSERKMGVQTLAMEDDEESLLEFKTDGTLVMTTDGLEPASADFAIAGQSLTADLWDNPQIVKTINADQLILIDKVDGVDIDYVYTRVK